MISLTVAPEPEFWKSLDIINFGKYEISSYGKIRNIRTGKIRSSYISDKGYHKCSIYDNDGNSKSVYIHRLVALAFIGPCPLEGYTIDHIDRNPSNNYYRNLQWASCEIQASNRNNTSTKKGRPVNQYSLGGKFIRKWNTGIEAGSALNIHSTSITAVCKGKRQSAGNFKWRYADEVDLIDGEIWKSIPYTEYGDVQISNMGRIKYSEGRISTGIINEGYCTTILKHIQTGKTRNFLIHRLVMATFIGISDLIVNHKDGNKTNNKLENLEYVTVSENVLHAYKTNLMKPNCSPVIRINKSTGEQTKYSTIRDASFQNRLTPTSISLQCRGKSASNDNLYEWKYDVKTTQTVRPPMYLTLNIIPNGTETC